MIFLNGRLVRRQDARIDPSDRGLLLGDGVFETLSSHAGRLPFLDLHLRRLEHGARVLGLPLPQHDLPEAVCDVLAANDLLRSDAVVRITLSRGPGPRGLVPPARPTPTLMVATVPSGATPADPASAVVATTRRNEHSPLSRCKSLNYGDNILARIEAAGRGADEALLLNTAGRLACASTANLFAVRAGRLLTPPPDEGVRPGVTRAVVLELAAGLGYATAEVSLTLDDLGACDEAFLTNSAVGVWPLGSLDGTQLGAGEAGPVASALRAAYRARVLASAPLSRT